ncbi:hypothetical protein QPK24_04820 [Paenibacillus polygoni]|uniref:PH domain-containing protein n=1 Tax=Paenibacillus polygoni TaxID=3050112 RepID=A0ABY8X4R7_9BACL|nr:hypothetical protein [Paenibacillus polygoni]WIV20043.1 hypothetical protein QPK24_04820 [Paenibacillus polygoni]
MHSISYRRKLAFGKAMAALIIISGCFLLVYALTGDNLGIAETIYYASGMLIGFWFVGPQLIVMLRFSFSKKPLFSYDHNHIVLNDGTLIPWSSIQKIELHESSMNKWVQSVPPFYRLKLKNREHVDINTYHVLSTNELNSTLKTLRLVHNGASIK